MKTLITIIKEIKMRKEIVITTMFASLCIAILSCSGQDNIIIDEDPKIVSEKYEPCCSSEEKVNYEIDGFKFFVPNVFTPNGDGVNDYFYPIFDENSERIPYVLNFVIFNSNDHSVRRGIFHTDQLFYNDLKSSAFDGIDYKINFGQKVQGQFWYEFTLNFDNKSYIIEGSACSIICDEEAPIFKDKEGCFFPAQVKSDFNGDGTLPSGEKDCFE